MQGNAFYSSYSASPKELTKENYTRYHEVTGNHWVFVERLKPPTYVPQLPKDLPETLPSGWKPPAGLIIFLLLSKNKDSHKWYYFS